MIAEAIDRIQKLAHDASRTQILANEDLPGVVFLRHGDELREIQVPPPRRFPAVLTLTDLVAMLMHADFPRSEVYVSHGQVEAFLDRDDRRETVVLPLAKTARLERIEALMAEPALTQSAAIKMLRFELYGPHAASLVTALRRVDFTRKSTGGRTVEHGKESLGRSVEAEVQQAGDIPDEFRVTLPVYQGVGFEASFTVGLHLDLAAERIELIPRADEVEAARLAVLGQIRELVAEKVGCPAFIGQAVR